MPQVVLQASGLFNNTAVSNVITSVTTPIISAVLTGLAGVTALSLIGIIGYVLFHAIEYLIHPTGFGRSSALSNIYEHIKRPLVLPLVLYAVLYFISFIAAYGKTQNPSSAATQALGYTGQLFGEVFSAIATWLSSALGLKLVLPIIMGGFVKPAFKGGVGNRRMKKKVSRHRRLNRARAGAEWSIAMLIPVLVTVAAAVFIIFYIFHGAITSLPTTNTPIISAEEYGSVLVVNIKVVGTSAITVQSLQYYFNNQAVSVSGCTYTYYPSASSSGISVTLPYQLQPGSTLTIVCTNSPPVSTVVIQTTAGAETVTVS